MISIEPILLFGAGVFLGTLVSIISLDRIYKGVMKRALDEVHKNYKMALDIKETIVYKRKQ